MQDKLIILQWGHMSVTTSPISGNSIVVPRNFNANSIENSKVHRQWLFCWDESTDDWVAVLTKPWQQDASYQNFGIYIDTNATNGEV